MHPVLILVPAAALIPGPRLWLRHVLKQHNRKENELPDAHDLQPVRVESTGIGDHYDPGARAVRLTRDKIDRKYGKPVIREWVRLSRRNGF